MTLDRRRFVRNSACLLSACALGAGMAAPSRGAGAAGSGAAARPGNGVELLGSYWTIAGGAIPHSDREFSPFGFRERVEAMAQQGFTGLGLWHADLEHVLQDHSFREMKTILDDNGIRHLELEFILDWFMDGERRRQSDLQRRRLLDAAEALSARHVKVGDFFNEQVPMPRLIESFSGLCADAANAGTRIVFELMPFSMLTSLEDTLTMLEGADADNGGVILDTWHIVKLGISYQDVARIPARFLLGVELNDGYMDTPEGMTLQDETTGHRQLCGEGEFDVPGFLAAVREAGFDGPYGVEILNADLRTWPLGKIVSRAWDTTMAQFQILAGR